MFALSFEHTLAMRDECRGLTLRHYCITNLQSTSIESAKLMLACAPALQDEREKIAVEGVAPAELIERPRRSQAPKLLLELTAQ